MHEIARLLWEFWVVLALMGPYLLFGFLVAGLLSAVLSARLIERHLGGEGPAACLKAAAFGVPLPLCSCGVIPVSASLRQHGAGRGPTTAFLISTPQTGVDSVLVTWSLLGPVYAIYRPIVAFLSGLAGGILVGVATRNQANAEKPADSPSPSSCGNGGCESDTADASACEKSSPSRMGVVVQRLLAGLRYGFVNLPEDIGSALLVGIVVAAAIGVFLPAESVPGAMSGGIVAMLVMMAAGIPVYVCATASVPIAAVLIAKGISPGAAMAFLMTGPATNAATIATIWKVMGRRTAGVYLLTVAVAAMAFGLLLDWFFAMTGLSPIPAVAHHHEQVLWWQHGSAGLLLAVLACAMIRKYVVARLKPVVAGTENVVMEQRIVLRVDGMSCNHCRAAVERALLEQLGVTAAEVTLRPGRAVVSGEALEAEALEKAVAALGYEVTVEAAE